MIFVDTNYFLRFLLKDNAGKQKKEAENLFLSGAEGKVKLVTSIIVFFEIYWVLYSFYKKNKQELINILEKILKMEFIVLQERDLLKQMLRVFKKTNIDLEDAFNLVYARKIGVGEFKTFDKKLSKEFGILQIKQS